MNDPIAFPRRGGAPADLRARIEEVFTPTSPVTRRELFAGRATQLQHLLDMVRQPGVHPVVFGERRCGKTSLASIVPEFSAATLAVVRVSAAAGDTFDTLWRRVADDVRTSRRRAERGLGTSAFPAGTPVALAKSGAVSREDVLALLAGLSAQSPAWVVLDDVDRISDADTRRRLRELAGATAAAAPGVTLVFAGTAASGDALLGPSASLVPLQVSRFTPDESVEAVLRALRRAGMAAEDVVVERVATLSNGLPRVTQSLARAAARAAGEAGCMDVASAHLDDAVREALAEAPAMLAAAYEQATIRARRGIYPEILLACALAPRDASGMFGVAGVCETVTRIVRREVRGLTNQVSALTEEGRGAVLEKQGAAKHARYRFVDTDLEPYILMRGLEEGWATHEVPSWLPGLPGSAPVPKAA